MDARGAMQSAVCPRCGTEGPPTGEPIVTCAQCKLGFSPREPRVRRRLRAPRLHRIDEADGVEVTIDGDIVTIRWSLDLDLGATALAVAIVIAVVAAMADLPSFWPYPFYVVAGGVAYLGCAQLGTGWIQLDRDQLRRWTRPLPLLLHRRIPRDEIGAIEIRDTRGQRGETYYYVDAVRTDGRAHVLMTSTTPEPAAMTARALREALGFEKPLDRSAGA